MVFGISDTEPQVWVSRGAWLVIIMSISAAWYLLINFHLPAAVRFRPVRLK